MILVTGATGATGGALVRLLSDAKVPVRAMVRDPARATALATLRGVEIVVGDLDSPDGLGPALDGVEKAYLVTNSTERAEDQQLNFIQAAKGADVKHIVKLSQYAAAADSPVRFLRYHAAVEAALRDSGVAWTMLRPNLFMQGMLMFADSVKREGRIFAPAGDARVSLIDIADIADAAFAALTQPNHVSRSYELTGPEALSFADIAQQLGAAVGRPISYVDIPGSALGEVMASFGAPAWQIEGAIEDFEHYRRGEASEVLHGVFDATGHAPRSFAAFAQSVAPIFVS